MNDTDKEPMRYSKVVAGMVTILESPGGKLNSQWGRVTYGDWCKLEAERISRSGSPAVVKERGGMVCVVKVAD